MLRILRGRVLAFGCGPHHPLVCLIFPLRRFPPGPRREAGFQERGALRASSPETPPQFSAPDRRPDMADKFDLYAHVTDSIIASIEAGT
ncbi:unnamed protein product, partial [Ectocarpus sp. 12 AP-2014]